MQNEGERGGGCRKGQGGGEQGGGRSTILSPILPILTPHECLLSTLRARHSPLPPSLIHSTRRAAASMHALEGKTPPTPGRRSLR